MLTRFQKLYIETSKTNQFPIYCEKCIFFASRDYLFMMASNAHICQKRSWKRSSSWNRNT